MAEIVDYTLTLNIPLLAENDLDTKALATMLGLVLNESMYCNHPDFFSQMFDHALIAQLKQSFRDVVETAMRDKYKHELIHNAAGTGNRSRWCVEADKLLDQLFCPCLSGGQRERTVTITKRQPQ